MIDSDSETGRGTDAGSDGGNSGRPDAVSDGGRDEKLDGRHDGKPNTASGDGTPGTATVAGSYTEMTELLLPNDTNNLGRALGGAVLHWMDICGAIAGMRFAGTQVVTASMDHVDFIAPIETGEVVVIEGYVFNTGRTSLDVTVDVRAENPRTDERRRTTTSYFTFVALGEDGEPAAVPDVECPSEEETALRDRAIEGRREQLRETLERYDR